MTDPVDLGDIFVVGQRRRPGGSFPSAGGGSGSDPGGPTQTEVGLDDPNPEQPYFDPCASADTALEWNSDAAMAEAKRRFRDKARELGDDDLYMREFHAFLYLNDSGQVVVGEVAYGDRVGTQNPGSVSPIWTGVTPGNLIGEVHNHPGGGMTPSGSDWQGFDINRAWIAQYAGSQNSDRYRQYIVARDVNDPTSDFLGRVYNNRSPRNNEPGPEVNPDGEPCP